LDEVVTNLRSKDVVFDHLAFGELGPPSTV